MSQLNKNRGQLDAEMTKDIIVEKLDMRICDIEMDSQEEGTIKQLLGKIDAVITTSHFHSKTEPIK